MKNIKNKIAATVTSGALLLSAFTPVALADINVDISRNGSRSDNTVSIRQESSTRVSQSNNADINNNISINSNTGGNRISDNIRGNSHIESGNSNSTIGIANFANLNYLRLNHNNQSWNMETSSNGYGDKNQGYQNEDYKDDKDERQTDWKANYRDDKKDHQEKDESNHEMNPGYSNHDYDNEGDKKDDYNHNDSDYGDHKQHSGGYDEDKHHEDQGDESDEYSDYHLEALLDGHQEVPGPGDSDGKGWAKVKIVPVNRELCIELHVNNIEPVTAAHIHKGPEGVAGPVVVNLPKPDAEGYVHACINADRDILEEIENEPSLYYINIHNEDYPNGAVRGQL